MKRMDHTEAVIESLSDYERERGKPAPSWLHACAQTNLLVALMAYDRKTYSILPELDIVLPDQSRIVPDIAVYPKRTVDFERDIEVMTELPRIAIEISSANQALTKLTTRVNRYLAAGVPACWLVLPELKAILIYTAPGTINFLAAALS